MTPACANAQWPSCLGDSRNYQLLNDLSADLISAAVPELIEKLPQQDLTDQF